MLDYIILILVSAVTYFWWSRRQKLKLREKLGLSGPPTTFFAGNIHQLAAYMIKHKKRRFDLFWQWRKEYGDIYGFYIGPNLNVVVNDLEMVKDVLVKQFTCFTDRMKMVMIDKDKISGKSIIHLHGKDWKDVRSILTPTFSTSKMKQMSGTISGKLDIFMANMEKASKSGKTVNIYDNFQGLTLDVIGECAFAMEVNCQNDVNDPFYVNCRKFFDEADFNKSRILQMAVLFPEFNWLFSRLRSYTGMGVSEDYLIEGLFKVVNQRLGNFKGFKSIDILQLLIEQNQSVDLPEDGGKRFLKNVGLDADSITANCFIFLLAGFETTSTALGFTAWLLAKHTDVQRKLQAEIDIALKDEKEVTYDLVRKLSYLDAVYREALRFYPPVIQFLSEKDYHSMAWLPFGAGPRNCIGMRFADMEYKMALVRLLSKYSLEFGPESEKKFALYDTPPVDEMLICMKGQQGREMRRLLSPIFSISKLKSMQYIMEEKLEIFNQMMEKRADSGLTFDISKSFGTLILEMTGQYCFGIESDCQRNHKDKFLNDCVNVFDNFDFEESYILQLAVLFPEYDHFLSKLRHCTGFGKAENSLMNVLKYVYEQRKGGEMIDTKKCVDMLRVLYELSEKQKSHALTSFSNHCVRPEISENNIISNALFFLEAGYETTSTALGFAAWLLARHTDIQQEIQAEIDEACTGMRVLDYNVIKKLPMLDAVFHESLRMYPPVVYFATRTCTKACTVGSYKFEPGVVIVLPVYNIHHDPESWPNPEIFDPYRFYKKHDHHPLSWVPFGAGPRNCIGLRFAEMEYKMTISTLLRNFNLELGPGSERELKVRQKGAFVQPCNGIIVKVTRR